MDWTWKEKLLSKKKKKEGLQEMDTHLGCKICSQFVNHTSKFMPCTLYIENGSLASELAAENDISSLVNV
jgi:hypothetical protein